MLLYTMLLLIGSIPFSGPTVHGQETERPGKVRKPMELIPKGSDFLCAYDDPVLTYSACDKGNLLAFCTKQSRVYVLALPSRNVLFGRGSPACPVHTAFFVQQNGEEWLVTLEGGTQPCLRAWNPWTFKLHKTVPLSERPTAVCRLTPRSFAVVYRERVDAYHGWTKAATVSLASIRDRLWEKEHAEVCCADKQGRLYVLDGTRIAMLDFAQAQIEVQTFAELQDLIPVRCCPHDDGILIGYLGKRGLYRYVGGKLTLAVTWDFTGNPGALSSGKQVVTVGLLHGDYLLFQNHFKTLDQVQTPAFMGPIGIIAMVGERYFLLSDGFHLYIRDLHWPDQPVPSNPQENWRWRLARSGM